MTTRTTLALATVLATVGTACGTASQTDSGTTDDATTATGGDALVPADVIRTDTAVPAPDVTPDAAREASAVDASVDAAPTTDVAPGTDVATSADTRTDAIVPPDASVPPDALAQPDASVPSDALAFDAIVQPDVLTADTAVPPDVLANDAPASDAAPAGTSRIRLAHLAPGVAAFDVCFKLHTDSAFPPTPVLRQFGRTEGLAYTQATQFSLVAAGLYDVRIVAAGAADCTTPLAGLASSYATPVFVDGGVYTVAATGLATGAPAFALTTFTTDLTEPAATRTRIAFAHTAPGLGGLDLGAIFNRVSTDFTPFSTNVAYGTSSAAVTEPAGTSTLAVRVNGTIPAAGAYPVAFENDFAAGNVYTVFAIGRADNLDTPLSVLVCQDDEPVTGVLGTCEVLPERAFVRFADTIVEGLVDICYRYTAGIEATPAFIGPIFRNAGMPSGLPFPSVSRAVPLPSGYTLQIAVVRSGVESTCSDQHYTGVFHAFQSREHVTVLLSGSEVGARSFNVDFLPDTTDYVTGSALYRFVNALSDLTPVNVYADSSKTTLLIPTVAFRTAGATATADENGFVPRTPGASNLYAFPNTTTMYPAAGIQNVAFTAGSITSVFAIGLQSTTTASDLPTLLVCDDLAAPIGLFSSCRRSAPLEF